MRYFISWVTKNYGFGNGFIDVDKPIENYDDLLKVEHQIRYNEKFPELPIVLNYKKVIEE